MLINESLHSESIKNEWFKFAGPIYWRANVITWKNLRLKDTKIMIPRSHFWKKTRNSSLMTYLKFEVLLFQ